MKLIDCFNRFMNDTVNLNQARFDKAKNGIDVMESFISNDATYGKILKECLPQGSFRQRTFIKPVGDNDFDVDLLVSVSAVSDWEPKDYLIKLADAFRASDRYKDKVDTRGKTRCVTIDYESDFHIDLVPSIEKSDGSWIANKKTNEFELTDGDGYASWFEGRNGITKGGLRRTVRMMKYLRDARTLFDTKSILLTTLLGMQISDTDTEDDYLDTPTSLLTIVGKLNLWLQARSTMPIVSNPVLQSEHFNRHWDQTKYTSFRTAIKKLSDDIEAAYDADDIEASLALWRKVFGNVFPSPGSSQSARAQPSTRQSEQNPAPKEEFLDELGIPFQDHGYTIKIDTGNIKDRGFREGTLRELLALKRPLLPKNRSLVFSVQKCTVPEPFDIYWKVRNYGDDAASHTDLRGEITKDSGSKSKRETTRYRGTHYVECYAVKNGVCVAFDRIEVPISGMFG